MNKILLIAALREKADISKREANEVVQIFFDSMTNAMAKGDRVEIRGLCSFFIKKYKAYAGRNPSSGEIVLVKPKKRPFFKCGKELKDRLNEKQA